MSDSRVQVKIESKRKYAKAPGTEAVRLHVQHQPEMSVELKKRLPIYLNEEGYRDHRVAFSVQPHSSEAGTLMLKLHDGINNRVAEVRRVVLSELTVRGVGVEPEDLLEYLVEVANRMMYNFTMCRSLRISL